MQTDKAGQCVRAASGHHVIFRSVLKCPSVEDSLRAVLIQHLCATRWQRRSRPLSPGFSPVLLRSFAFCATFFSKTIAFCPPVRYNVLTVGTVPSRPRAKRKYPHLTHDKRSDQIAHWNHVGTGQRPTCKRPLHEARRDSRRRRQRCHDQNSQDRHLWHRCTHLGLE